MKHLIVIAAVAGAFALGHAFAQEGEKKMQWNPPEWMKKSKEHEKLAESTGTFDVKMELFMEPGKPPMVVEGSATRTSIKNGFWIREDFKCSWMGHPFEGTLIQGYDNFRKQHVHVWFDNSSPILWRSATARSSMASGSTRAATPTRT